MNEEINELFGRTWREQLPPICPTCGYNLTGASQGRCPECGGRFLWTEVRDQAKRVYHEIKNVDDMNEMVRIGYYVAASGAACLLVLEFMGLGILGRALAMLLGIGALGAGVQVFRARQLPRWSREFMPHPPDLIGGWVNILVSLGLIAGSIFLPKF